ncbi:MAG: chemotaxis protein CheW [Gammaproteobacteria bacterium]
MSETKPSPELQLDDCWNRIGVWGHEPVRCEKLLTHIHCRNCEVYSAAGRKILERQLPAEYEASWATVYAEAEVQQLAGTEPITIFRLGNEWMAISTLLIKEVTEVHSIHCIPHSHNPVLRGLVNLNGQLRICVSLGHLLDIEKSTEAVQSDFLRVYNRMLHISDEHDDFVFFVSEVKDSFRIDPAALSPAPATIARAKGSFIRGLVTWQGHDVACLDGELLFYNLRDNLA